MVMSNLQVRRGYGDPRGYGVGVYGDRNSVPTAALSVIGLVFDGPTGRHGDLERSSSKYPVSINEEIANFSAQSISGSGERERVNVHTIIDARKNFVVNDNVSHLNFFQPRGVGFTFLSFVSCYAILFSSNYSTD